MDIANNRIDKVIFQDYNDTLKDNFLDLMNAGYYPTNSNLSEEDLFFEHNATLYTYALENLIVSNKTILDIACGRGGGPRIYKKYFDILDAYGCDINKNSVDYANKKNKTSNYSVKSLEKLEYDIRFDVVTIVEASWHIKNYNSFYDSLNNVLNNDGIFICLDYFTPDHVIRFEDFGKNFKHFKSYNITDNVIESCKIEINKLKKQNTEISKFLIPKYEDNYDSLIDGGQYLKYVFSNMELN